MIKSVIFDFDNTLMDFIKMKERAVESAVEAMIDAGLSLPKETMVDKIYDVYQLEGIEDQQIFDKVLKQELGKIDYRILASGIIGYRRAKEGAMNLYPHVHLSLSSLLKRGLRLAIISDAPRLPVWLRICALGISHYFDCVVTFDDSGERKPSPKPFQLALNYLQLSCGEVLMVGDWVERDILGAKNLGMKTVFARYGATLGYQNSGADYEIDDILEILKIVEKENKI